MSAKAQKRENKMNKKFFVTLVSWICLMSILSMVSNVYADQITSTQALRIVSQYQGVFTSVPTQNNTQETTNAPLLGNGDLGVSIQNNINSMVFILGKNEFWSLNDGMVKAMARLSLSIPGMSGSSYSMKENIATAEITGSFALNGNTIITKSWVQADNTINNMLITQFVYTGSGTQNVSVSLAVGNQTAYGNALGSSGDVLYIDVKADNTDNIGGYATCKVRVATRVVGTTGTITNNTLNFALSPGNTYTLITSIMSNYDSTDFQTQTVSSVAAAIAGTIDSLNASHHAWWSNFYTQSFVEMPNKTIEKEYYGSLYLMACCSRTHESTPGLWGNWVMENPAWNGDYTLNYNYESPFLMAFPTNHVELADCYDKTIIDWIPIAEAQAKDSGWTGAFYRCHLGPLPNGSSDKTTHNQRLCGAYADVDMLWHYYYTRDSIYAASIYPALKDVALFWQNYLTLDGTRYVIYKDAQIEDAPFPQTNGIISLGLVRFLLQGCINISTVLNVDSSSRAVWQDRLSKLSAYPTFTRNGQTIFRYTEVGMDFVSYSGMIQGMYPGNSIGLSSDSTLLQIAKNTAGQVATWDDGNSTPTFYPCAARLGLDPNTILSKLQTFLSNHTYPNLHIYTNGGGVENFNTVPSTICEMFVQSFQDTVRFFPDWPSATYGKFGDLLTYGNFLVSSDIETNGIQYVRIISNKGRGFSFVNPWPGQTLQIYRNGVGAGTLSGDRITISTAVNEIIHLAPSGTSYNAILARMRSPGGQIAGVRGGAPGPRSAGSCAISKKILDRTRDKAVSFTSTNAPDGAERMTVDIYSLNGTLVRKLASTGNLVRWNMTSQKNMPVAVGLYAYTIRSEGKNSTIIESGNFQIVQ